MNKRKKTDDQQIIELVKEGLTHREIADKMGVTASAIQQRIKKIEERQGIKLPRRTNIGKIDDEQIIELTKKGLTQQEIADRMGVTQVAIQYRIKRIEERQGIKLPRRTDIRKIDNEQIIEWTREGLMQQEIADRMGVTKSTIKKRIKRIEESQGIKLPRQKRGAKRKNDGKDQQIIEWTREGLTQQEIADRMGVTKSAIQQRIKRIEERQGIKLPRQEHRRKRDIQPVMELNSNDNRQKLTTQTTTYSLEEFITQTKNEFIRPKIVLGDGISMNIQASAYHYCEPRKSGLDIYDSYELGYPSEVIEQLRKYVQTPIASDAELLQSRYLFVPAGIVSQILMEHGGIDKEATFCPEKKLAVYKEEKSGMKSKNKKAATLINQLKTRERNDLESQGKGD